MQRGTCTLVIALAFAGLFSHSAIARDVQLKDIVGRWCGETSDYTFSTTQLVVLLHSGKTPKHGPVLKISSADSKDSHITVNWLPKKAGNATEFELSENGRELVQQPQTEGDKGPRRVFHRC